MANQWLRLWHDMPTDPKWRTIARASGQPISLVQAVYLHLLVDASRNVTRGHATVTQEDLASSLDVTEDAVKAVLEAMQGRVLEEMRLLGWDARQPKREDVGDESTGAKSAAQRKAEQRERDRLAVIETEEQACHDESRNVTLDKDKEEIKIKNNSLILTDESPRPSEREPAIDLVGHKLNGHAPKTVPDCPHTEILELWAEVMPDMRQHDPSMWTAARAEHLRARWRATSVLKGWATKEEGLRYFRKLFGFCRNSDFLMGRAQSRDRRPFEFELAWLVNATNWTKVHEGKFHG